VSKAGRWRNLTGKIFGLQWVPTETEDDEDEFDCASRLVDTADSYV
jgi:hypothetical protein